MHDLPLITTIAAAFTAAWLLGLLTHRLGLSPIVGYLLAGVLVGPHTPGFVADADLAEQLAEIGVILLMFGVGLQFHVKELLAVAASRIPGAVAQSVVATAPRRRVAAWPAGSQRAVFGMALSVASTVVLMRVLMDHDRAAHAPATSRSAGSWSRTCSRWSCSCCSAAARAMRPARRGCAGGLVTSALAAPKLAALVAFVMLGGSRAIPWVLVQVARLAARAVHAHGARSSRSPSRSARRLLRRLDGARRVPGRHGGRAIPGQPSGRGGCAADARRVRRAVLRVGRDALRPGIRRPRP